MKTKLKLASLAAALLCSAPAFADITVYNGHAMLAFMCPSL